MKEEVVISNLKLVILDLKEEMNFKQGRNVTEATLRHFTIKAKLVMDIVNVITLLNPKDA